MISLTTAKLFLIIALFLGPKYEDTNHVIQITSTASPGNAVWTQKAQGWNLDEKPFPTHDWPANGTDFSTQDLNTYDAANKPILRAIFHHNWKQDGVLYLDNGDRIEKLGAKILYTVNAGAYNQQTYTIFTMENDVPL